MSENNNEIKLHALDYWQVVRNRYGVILLAFFLIFMTATVITYMMPKEYLGRVSIEINKDSRTAIGEQARNSEPYQTFMQTQFAIIESKENLDRVAKELDLRSIWGLATDQEAYSRLVRKLRAQDLKGTDLVNVEVFDTDPDLAAKLANSVADAYKNRREQLDRDRINRKIEELAIQATKQGALMAKAQQEMFRIQEDEGISDHLANNRWGGSDLPDSTMNAIVVQRKIDLHEMRQEIGGMRTTIQALRDLDGKELIPAAVELGLKSPTLAGRYPEYQSAVLEQQRLINTGLGANHPKLIEIVDTARLLEEMLVAAVETSKAALGTQMDIKELELKNMEVMMKESEEELMGELKGGVGYVAARNEYELRRRLHEELNQRIALAKVDGDFSQDPIVI
ncbi:MAG: succinoglycan biosynthesis transport protein ExoP, partial [Verrucomicrobiales bacterium]